MSIAITNLPPFASREDGTLYVYAAKINLKQGNLGYTPTPGQPPTVAADNVVVYADEVTLSEDLILPGKTLEICARNIYLDKEILINVAGPDATTTYIPGVLPGQTNTNPAAPGAKGGDANNGSNAGSINITADHISAASPESTVPIILQDSVESEINTAIAKLKSKLPSELNVPPFSIPFDVPQKGFNVAGVLKVDGLVLKSFNKNTKVGSIAYDPIVHTLNVDFEIGNVVMAGNFAADFVQPQAYNTAPVLLGTRPFTIIFSIEYTLDPKTNKITKTTTQVHLTSPVIIVPDSDFYLQLLIDVVINASIWRHFKTVNTMIDDALNKALKPVTAEFNAHIGAITKQPKLYLYARGGQGGRGQDGNNGMGGPKIEKNICFNMFTLVYYGTGGAAGSPGTSGTGGNGGAINLNLVTQDPLIIVANAEGGPGGAIGMPGQVGGGYPWNKANIPLGNFGASGKMGTMKVNGSSFQNGSPITALTRAELGALLNTDQLLFTQRMANYEYLNGRRKNDFAQLSEYYTYLSQVNVAAALSKLGEEDKNIRSSMRDSANVELLRLSHGLNFFGNVYNWTPVFGLDYLQTLTVTMIGLTKNIEDQYNIYINKDSTIEDKISALKSTQSKVTQQLTALNSELDKTIPDKIKSALKDIHAYSDEIEKQMTVVSEFEAQLYAAIQKSYTGATCRNATPFIKCLGTIVPIATGIATENPIAIIGGVASAATTLAGDGATFAGQQSLAVKAFHNSQASFSDMQTVYDEIKSLITAQHPDAGKMAVLEDEFKTFLKPLLSNLGRATSQLEVAVEQLIYLNKCRNQKVIQYNGLYVQIGKVKAQIAQQNAEANRISSLLSKDKGNLVPAKYLNYLKNSLAWSYTYLLEKLYEQHRAFDFFSAQFTPQPILNSMDVAYISDTQLQLIKEKTRFLNSSHDRTELKNSLVLINAEKYPLAFKKLSSDQTVAFSLPITLASLSGYNLVKLETLTMSFPDLSGVTGTLFVDIMLAGNYSVQPIGASDPPVNFTSPARLATLGYDCGSATTTGIPNFINIGDVQCYAAPSPFTHWQLKLHSTDPDVVSAIPNIKTINMYLDGYAYGNVGETEVKEVLADEIETIADSLISRFWKWLSSFWS